MEAVKKLDPMNIAKGTLNGLLYYSALDSF
jgi:hypothetical protein